MAEAAEARKELVTAKTAADELRMELERRVERTEQQLRRSSEAAEDAQRQAATLQVRGGRSRRTCARVSWFITLCGYVVPGQTRGGQATGCDGDRAT